MWIPLSYNAVPCPCSSDEAEADPHATGSRRASLHHPGAARLVGGAHDVRSAMVTLSRQQHVMACALEVHRQNGHKAPAFVAEQVGALALTEDLAGLRCGKKLLRRSMEFCGLPVPRKRPRCPSCLRSLQSSSLPARRSTARQPAYGMGTAQSGAPRGPEFASQASQRARATERAAATSLALQRALSRRVTPSCSSWASRSAKAGKGMCLSAGRSSPADRWAAQVATERAPGACLRLRATYPARW